jgi:hypothetical protein
MTVDTNGQLDLIDAVTVECERLSDVIAGAHPFNSRDYVKFRGLVADLKRQDDAEIALFGRKLDEIYRCVERLDILRKTLPEDSRPIRKVKAEIVRIMATIDRARERIAAEVYRKAGERYGV